MLFKEMIKKIFWISLEERFTAQCNQTDVSISGGSATETFDDTSIISSLITFYMIL